MRKLRVAVAIAVLACSAGAVDRKSINAQYKGKFFQVQREGLAVAVCGRSVVQGGILSSSGMPHMDVKIDGDQAKYNTSLVSNAMLTACSDVVPEPVHVGELLVVMGASASKDEIRLGVRNVEAHEVERGTGTGYEHINREHGYALLKFKIPKEGQADEEIGRWLKPFEKQEQAAKFGGAAVVKQINAGMTTDEVETVLGPPITHVDLDSKVLYKYPDMTVEFKDGKVVDVR